MTIYIVPIEPIDNRYTQQWYDNIPQLITQHAKGEVEVVTIDGDTVPDQTTDGAFLDFAATNYYKATQTAKISKMFMDGKIKPGDKFLVTDAWNFVITPIKYMSELLDIPVEIHGIWHAGAYDPSDILGKQMTQPWPSEAERSWFYACDYNYFATDTHRRMFLKNLQIPEEYHYKAIRSGQPYECIIDLLEDYTNKEDRVMWPHRYNYDKQPDIAEWLGANGLNVFITQKHDLNKAEYYDLLGRSKVIFSCSLHENLGVSMIEGVLAGAIPIVPNRCCYSDIYLQPFIYPSVWTESAESFLKHENELREFIQYRIDHYNEFLPALKNQRTLIKNKYISSNIMLNLLTK